jgi:tetratricopeptide (TPR) repeat protein
MVPINTQPPSTALLERLTRLGAYLEADPSNQQLLRDYAEQAWLAHEFEACASAWARVQTLAQPTPEPADQRARALIAAGQVSVAIAELEAAVRLWPEHDYLHSRLAYAHYVNQDHEAALAALPNAATSARPDACALRVRVLHHLGRLGEAAAAATAFETREGRTPVVDAALLRVLIDLSRPQEALARVRDLLGAGGEQHLPYEAYEVLALEALEQGDTSAALGWTDRSLHVRQDDGRIWLLEGLAHMRTSQWAPAGQALQRAVDHMPTHAGSHLALGWLHLVRNDLDAAEQVFAQSVAVSPAFSEGHGSLAVVAVRRGNFAQADTLIRKALLLDRNCASARLAKALREGAPQPKIEELALAITSLARSTQATVTRQDGSGLH